MNILTQEARLAFPNLPEMLLDQIAQIRDTMVLGEEFDSLVRSAWLVGYARRRNHQLTDLLKDHYGNQKGIADFLGLKDRSGISKKMTSNGNGTGLTGSQIWTILLTHFHEFCSLFEDEENAAAARLEGFAEASTAVKRNFLLGGNHVRVLPVLLPVDLERLRYILSDADWMTAVREQDKTCQELIAVKCCDEICIDDPPEFPLDHVQRLVDCWSRPVLLCVHSLVS